MLDLGKNKMIEPANVLILNVDDHEATLYAKSRVLQRAGFQVIEAQTGEETLRLVEERRPHLVLLDVNLPDVSGIEICRRIKSRDTSVMTLVLQISASFLSSSDKARALEGGADNYLTEPVEPEELVATVNSLLRLQQVEIELRRKGHRLELLAQAAEHLLATEDLNQAVQNLFEKMADHFQLSHYFNFMAEEESGRLRLDSSVGLTEEEQASIQRVEYGQTVCGAVAKDRLRQVVEDVQHSFDPKTDLIRRLGIRAYVCHPLIIGHRLLGTLSFGTTQKDSFTDDDIEFFRTICYYVAMAKERERLMEVERQRGAQLALIADENQALYEKEQAARVEAEGARKIAEDANRLKDEFLATVSHELRAPLNTIKGWAVLLQRGGLNQGETTKAIETIGQNVEAQNRLIEDLLDGSRIISGKLHLEPEPLNLAELIESVTGGLRQSATAKKLQLQFTAEPGVGLVPGDRNRLRQVIWNLLSNAIKFTPFEGQINILLKRAGPFAELSVADSGVGIRSDFLPFVFDRFRQADGSTTREFGGLGLGLAIVQHIVELHKGQVFVHSEGEGKGATFTVRIPLANTSIETTPAQQKERGARSSLKKSVRLDDLRVLLVDDDRDAREMLTILLREYGADVVSASSSAEALTLIECEDVDVIVSDIGMPHEDGYHFIHQVREQKANRNSRKPAVALTGFTRSVDRMRVLAAGFHSHVAKPVDARELAVVLASLTGRLKFENS